MGLTSDFKSVIFELNPAVHEIDHIIKHLKGWMSPTAKETPVVLGLGKSYEVREPLGVCAILGSWNFPYFTILGPLISAIAAGNCAVIKPSEFAPFSSVIIKRLVVRNLDTSAYIVVQGAV